MKRPLLILLLTGFLAVTATATLGQAQHTGPESVASGPYAAIILRKGNETPTGGDFVVGYQFSNQTLVTITHVGLFDQNGDGVLNGTAPAKIGLWDAHAKLLVSAEVPLDSKPEEGAFYVAIKPLELSPGSYVIAYASPASGERYWFNSEIKTAPEIKWEQGLYASGRDLVLPDQAAPNASYFGPVFKIVAGNPTAAAAGVPATPLAPALSLTKPADRAIFQRDGHNLGTVPIVCSRMESADRIEARAANLKTGRPASDWTPLTPASATGGYAGSLHLPAGWYRLELRALAGGKTVATATVEHVGVGEVFLTAGQSNSCNHGRPRQSPQDDRVSACNWQTGEWRHADDPQPGAEGDGGSPWPLLGDLLAKQYEVPIGFVSVGVGATGVMQWLPGGELYPRIQRGLVLAGPHGVRAVLWHQGEQDSVAGTSAEEYAHALGLIIVKSRRDAGWNVPWGVALVSYHPSAPSTEVQAPIVAGQKFVIEREQNVFMGPATDDFHNHDYMADGVHFNSKGLAAHVAGWAKSLAPLLNQ